MIPNTTKFDDYSYFKKQLKTTTKTYSNKKKAQIIQLGLPHLKCEITMHIIK